LGTGKKSERDVGDREREKLKSEKSGKEKGSGVEGDSQVAGEYDERAPAVFGDLMQNRHVHLLILVDGDIPKS
jgi:hypothetical protein